MNRNAHAVHLALAAALVLASGLVSAGETLTGTEIVRRAHEAAGGRAWLRAGTNVMRGHAELCRDGRPEACVRADRYEMYRVYPVTLRDAHAGSGKFRLDARAGDRVLFQMSFDGQRSYDQHGPVDGPRAATDEGTGFGFSAIRFALEEGFRVERLLDDQIEGRATHTIRVTDPSGEATLFGIDTGDFRILSAAWQSPRGWHERRYSDFYRVGSEGFLQPGRVRHYYEGVKSVDIRWTSAEIGTPIPGSTFVFPYPPTNGTTTMERINHSTGSKWEPIIGYSRAVRIGNFVYVSGTTASGPDGNIVGIDDPYAQTRQILENIGKALAAVGAGPGHVVRTRIYLTDISRWEEVGRAHGEVFADIRPATAMVEVAKLISPEILVEIEADAYVP